MEPSEFDQIVRGKLQEEHQLHHREIDASKPFVWAAIQANKTLVVPWYYLAAAAILFLVCSTFLFFNLQEQNRSEIDFLAAKVERLKNKTNAVEIIARKNQQLDLLCSEVEALEHSLTQVNVNPNPTIISKQIVYQTDTVFITQTEYITQYLPAIKEEKIEEPQVELDISADNYTTSDLIYPDFNPSTRTTPKKENTSVKVKIDTLSSN
ncbi:MAG: hypothetical protein JKY48_04275 [Flavobacteriales bacterium]|nr:hypothetical protein [Flavobacteriales bacterium]